MTLSVFSTQVVKVSFTGSPPDLPVHSLSYTTQGKLFMSQYLDHRSVPILGLYNLTIPQETGGFVSIHVGVGLHPRHHHDGWLLTAWDLVVGNLPENGKSSMDIVHHHTMLLPTCPVPYPANVSPVWRRKPLAYWSPGMIEESSSRNYSSFSEMSKLRVQYNSSSALVIFQFHCIDIFFTFWLKLFIKYSI